MKKATKSLTHISAAGEASMVDVSHKPIQLREAVAQGEIHLQKSTLDLIDADRIAKGNVLATARVAGIMAAKRTGDPTVLLFGGEVTNTPEAAVTVIGTLVKLEPPQWSHSCTTVLWSPASNESLVLRLFAFTTYFRSLST